MAELMLINPRKRRRAKRKMTAKQRRYFGKRPKAKRRRRTAVVAAPKRRRTYMSNPRRRKKYRSNPIGGFRPMSFVNQTLMPAAIGGAGALGLDILLGALPLPAMLKTPAMRPIVRIAGAVGIGILAGMVTNKRLGEQVGAGALTVVLYDTIKGFAKTTFPTLNLGDIDSDYPQMEYLSPAPQVDDMGVYVGDSNTVGEYVY